ncbi:hypothetical protein TBR22_A43530 [Luteitalea sp. TBR-22]|uniref:PEP-CTERM sorting domain-containing protein n=1 Tax=Luteitalea sp. TBR-22 TaxID=2802971 RepID=UPI001AF62DB8|nr:PEP-CTERM sorting domain-containing protein [Luteitalea sp. TBR-22]BCS35127.1 hypothetical protein TBR22_A43530 [Luteitalea sp. TBR-22]
MRRLSWLLSLAVLGTAHPAQASTIVPGPFLTVCANTECVEVPDAFAPVNDSVSTVETRLQLAGSTVVISGLVDRDPFIAFTVMTTNFVPSPLTFSILFGTPIVPANYRYAVSSLSATVSSTPTTAAVVSSPGTYPTFLSGYGTLGAAPTNLGVDLGTTSCASAAGNAPTTCAYGSTSNTFSPTAFDGMRALLTYQQTGGGSMAAWQGRVDLLEQAPPVPEPGTLAMLVVALGAPLVRRRRTPRP